MALIFGCAKDGVNGKNTLVDIITEPAGENCSNGGFKIISGIDLNNNNIIDSEEIKSTEFVCNGENGSNGINSLTNIISEPQGINCENGGFKIISGVDQNNNNILDLDEIQTTEFICNGENGSNGLNSIINMIPEPDGNNCSFGGFKVISGLDLNNNNTLDDDEIQNTNFLCNTDPAYNNSDNLTRLVVSRHDVSASSTGWTINQYPTYNLPDFCKNDYSNIDSIIFVPSMHTNDPNTKCIVELYNITDGLSIENSQIESNMPGYNFHYSQDIANYLPPERIDIGVRIKSEHQGVVVSTGMASYLYIFKH